jgi:hypothetical protein
MSAEAVADTVDQLRAPPSAFGLQRVVAHRFAGSPVRRYAGSPVRRFAGEPLDRSGADGVHYLDPTPAQHRE